ncbi:MAG: PfkB family carbohydrate kinase [Candidatus Acidiferrales bacterium]|jgi:sulfofructose kinase
MPRELPIVDVVGVGLNATDTLIRVPHFPALDSKVRYIEAVTRAGGEVASALAACQRWGLRTRYIGKIGDDAAGELQRTEFAREGVGAHLTVVPNCQSQSAFILVDEATGERTILWQRDPRLDIAPEELDRESIVRARLLHVTGSSNLAMSRAAKWARAAGIPVTLDVDNVYPDIQVLLEDVDFLISSRGFPAKLTADANPFTSLPALAKKFGCRLLVSTLGREGVLAWDGSRFHYSPAIRVSAIDTTGAGDIFHGGFIYGLLAAWPLDRILDFACAAAALNCTALGARAGIGSVDEIERLRREGPRYPSAFSSSDLVAARSAL